jgi:hypothetical protein
VLPAAASGLDLGKLLKPSLGDAAPAVEQQIAARQFKDSDGSRPEDKLESGDILIYPKVQEPGSLVMPPAWDRAMQGFGHASIVARENGRLFHLDSPQIHACDADFRGNFPYIVLRPRKQTIGAIPASPEKFKGAVDRLASNMRARGFEYDAEFKDSVMRMNPEERAKLRARIAAPSLPEGPELKTQILGPSRPPTPVPAMYCSAVPVTIYALLGVMPTNSISASDLMKTGLQGQEVSGKSKAEAAREISHGILAMFKTNHEQSAEWLAISIKNGAIPAGAKLVQTEADIERHKKLAQQIEHSEEKLASMLSQAMGEKGSVKEKIEFSAAGLRTIVRPVDFLKDAASGNGHFEIAGYYDGGMDSTCATAPQIIPAGVDLPADMPPPPALTVNPQPDGEATDSAQH